MKLLATLMSFVLLSACAGGITSQHVQTAHTIDQASVAALNAFCSVAESQSDVELGKVCGSVLGTVNQTQVAIDTALAFITALLAKRAQEKAFSPEAMKEAQAMRDRQDMEHVSALANCHATGVLPHEK